MDRLQYRAVSAVFKLLSERQKHIAFALLLNSITSVVVISSATINRWFWQNTCELNIALSMEAPTLNCGIAGLVLHHSIQLLRWEGQIYHYGGALMPADQLRPALLSVYIFYSAYSAQVKQRTRSCQK